MSQPTTKSLPERIQPWLTLTSSVGLSVGAVWATVAALWKSAAGEWSVSKRLLLVLSAVTISLFVLCIWRILKQRRKILAFRDSQVAPFRVSDDYRFVPESGFWVEKKTGLRVCPSCLLPPTKIVSPLLEGLGLDLDGNDCLVWRCGNCRSEYWHKSQKAAP
jgi:hypothetical protein